MMFRVSSSRLVPTTLAILVSACFALPAQAERTVYNFNPGWLLTVADPANAELARFDDSAWKPVSLPRAWNEDDAFSKDIVDHSTGIAWYRKHFNLPAAATGQKVFIEFEGARQAAEVFVNGKRVGLHENGVTAFGFDISDLVKPGGNVVAVRTDNRWDYREKSSNSKFQWADKNFNANYGGLPKNVRLHTTDKLYQTLPLYSTLGTTGVYVYARDFNIARRSAAISAESEVRNESSLARTFTYEVRIRDRDGKQVAQFQSAPLTVAPGATVTAKASAPVANLNFWSWGYGYLYDVVTTLKVDGKPVDSVTTRTGFRKTEFANGMIKLNDRAIQVHGYAQRTSNEWPALGMSVPPWMSDYSNALAVEGNANLIRWMHITPWKQDVESLDRVGLMQAMPAGDSEKDVTDRRWPQRVSVMRDAIIYNRNSPSIVFYEAGNAGVSEEHMAEMKALRDKYDPFGGRAAGSREMRNSKVAEYGGEMLYIDKSARLPFWMMEYSRDEGARKFWDELSPPFHKDGDGPQHRDQDAKEYNRNQDSHAIENVVRWNEYYVERPGTGSRVNSGGVNIIFSDSNTHHRGAENFRRSGEVDAIRLPKDGFFAHQVMWDGWVDVEKPRAHIIGHWNYAAGTVKTVTVVSSAARVELFLDGKKLGQGKRSENFLFTFDKVTWAPGELKAVGYDAAGKQVCESVLTTAGVPVALKLTPIASPVGMRADGADVTLVQVETVDAKGRRNPVALNTVKFDLSGPAEWRGGIAQGPNNHILDRSLPVEGGVNRVIVRSGTTPGKIVVRATSQGLASAELTIESVAAPTEGGLSTRLPAEGLPLRLDRGPTPAAPSYRVTRVAVPVKSVEASSNPEQAGQSVDDDETTTWSSTPADAAPAIVYHLARAAAITEITMKLTGWKERRYPLRITVDDQEVFKGSTPTGLGYATVALTPRKGSVLKIEMTGPAELVDKNKLVEVANQANTDTGARKIGKRVLSIVEAEFYEAP